MRAAEDREVGLDESELAVAVKDLSEAVSFLVKRAFVFLVWLGWVGSGEWSQVWYVEWSASQCELSCFVSNAKTPTFELLNIRAFPHFSLQREYGKHTPRDSRG